MERPNGTLPKPPPIHRGLEQPNPTNTIPRDNVATNGPPPDRPLPSTSSRGPLPKPLPNPGSKVAIPGQKSSTPLTNRPRLATTSSLGGALPKIPSFFLTTSPPSSSAPSLPVVEAHGVNSHPTSPKSLAFGVSARSRIQPPSLDNTEPMTAVSCSTTDEPSGAPPTIPSREGRILRRRSKSFESIVRPPNFGLMSRFPTTNTSLGVEIGDQSPAFAPPPSYLAPSPPRALKYSAAVSPEVENESCTPFIHSGSILSNPDSSRSLSIPSNLVGQSPVKKGGFFGKILPSKKTSTSAISTSAAASPSPERSSDEEDLVESFDGDEEEFIEPLVGVEDESLKEIAAKYGIVLRWRTNKINPKSASSTSTSSTNSSGKVVIPMTMEDGATPPPIPSRGGKSDPVVNGTEDVKADPCVNEIGNFTKEYKEERSHISEEQAEAFIQQKATLPNDYHEIVDDPRYLRIVEKWNPNIFTSKGLVQFAKKKVDPSSIPYIGLLFHASTAAQAAKSMSTVDNLRKDQEDEVLDKSILAMKGAQRSKALEEAAYTGISALFLAIPVFDIVPGLSAQLALLGPIGAQMAGSGIHMGIQVVVTNSTKTVANQVSTSTEAFQGYESCKAFLLYLGYPKNDDPLYAPWESARIRIKAVYGCAPEDDLYTMKKTIRFARYLQERQKIYGINNYEIEIPLLLHLFAAFKCWDELYWDRFAKMKQGAVSKLGIKTTTIEEKRRVRDLKRLEHSAKAIELHIPPIDRNLRLIDTTLSHERERIRKLLTEVFMHSNRFFYVFSKKKMRIDQEKTINSYIKLVVNYFFEHNVFCWGYFDETTNDLLGVSIWEHPDARSSNKINFNDMVTSSSSLKLGPSKLGKVLDVLKKSEDCRKEDVRGVKVWMLHMLAVKSTARKRGIGRMLVENTILRHKEPIYLQVYDCEAGLSDFFKKLCFMSIRINPANCNYFGRDVQVECLWHGIDRPEEIKALMPQKSPSILALTLKKTTSSLDTLVSSATSFISETALKKSSQDTQQSLTLESSTTPKALPAPSLPTDSEGSSSILVNGSGRTPNYGSNGGRKPTLPTSNSTSAILRIKNATTSTLRKVGSSTQVAKTAAPAQPLNSPPNSSKISSNGQ